MTRRDDPGLRLHRVLQYVLTGAATILMGIASYIGVKYDKTSDAVLQIGPKVDGIAEDVNELKVDVRSIRADANETRRDVDRIDANWQVVKESNWFQKQVDK